MRVLVTGGAGYIGSVTVAQLCDAGHEVTVLDNLAQGHRAAVDARADFVEGDLAELRALRRLFRARRPEGILHFASHTLVGESMERPFLHLGDNVRNGINLLEAAAEHGARRGTQRESECQDEPGNKDDDKFVAERIVGHAAHAAVYDHARAGRFG